MLLTPVAGSTGSALGLALDRGARVVAAGPMPGSVIIAGRRDSILPAMMAAGTLVTAATPILCGDLPIEKARLAS